ncbi:hypothetical protein Acr_23g0008690 [Actinidia rufa]|uniref:Uncharacterized protein n=1 Tax=Actinidia rufa TaxID=165716 RepID=A0A7J0GPD4_9ERIC|nr:hypothetical protein Acr_23g0008690 [Actinidia rufa]
MVVVGAIGCRRGALLSWMGGFFQANQFSCGWGGRVKLWKHRWCGDETLAIAFLAICRLAADRDAPMSVYLSCGFRTGVRRFLLDWELEQLFWAAHSVI